MVNIKDNGIEIEAFEPIRKEDNGTTIGKQILITLTNEDLLKISSHINKLSLKVAGANLASSNSSDDDIIEDAIY